MPADSIFWSVAAYPVDYVGPTASIRADLRVDARHTQLVAAAALNVLATLPFYGLQISRPFNHAREPLPLDLNQRFGLSRVQVNGLSACGIALRVRHVLFRSQRPRECLIQTFRQFFGSA